MMEAKHSPPETMEDLDLMIIGGGAAGLAAAQYAVDSNARVVLVEPGPLGGDGFHRGPEPFLMALDGRGSAAEIPDWTELRDAARQQARTAAGRWQKELDEAGLRWIRGRAVLTGSHRVDVQSDSSEVFSFNAQAVILAAGSQDRSLPAIPFDATQILGSDHLEAQDELPESLLVVGGNPLALEWAYVLKRLGRKVFLCEEAEEVLTGQDPDLVEHVEAWLKNYKIKMLFRKGFRSIYKSGPEVRVTLDGGVQFAIHRLVFTGARQVDSKQLSRGGPFPDCGEYGEILVNEKMETTAKGVYAAGSATGHGRSFFRSQEEGRVAAANALGKKRTYHPEVVPLLVRVQPPMGAVGCCQREAHHFGFRGIEGRAGLEAPEAGPNGTHPPWCKLVVDRESRQVIGGQVVGAGAAEMVLLIQLAMRKGLSARDLAQISVAAGAPSAVLAQAARNCLRALSQ